MEKYTTTNKISADKTGEEKEKTVISNDAFAISEFLDELKKILESARQTLNR